jgi:thioredoxin 2
MMNPNPSGNAGSRRIGTILVIVVVAVLAIQILFKSAAPTPAALAGGTTLDDAITAGATDGKVVFVVAHADWCGPCQTLKRGALSDVEVAQWLQANAHAVSLDVTKMDATTPDWVKRAAKDLDISGIPAMVLMRDGKVISRQVGSMPAKELLTWLNEAGSKASPESTPG